MAIFLTDSNVKTSRIKDEFILILVCCCGHFLLSIKMLLCQHLIPCDHCAVSQEMTSNLQYIMTNDGKLIREDCKVRSGTIAHGAIITSF